MTATKRLESVEGLKLSLNGQDIGVLTHYSGGKNIFVFIFRNKIINFFFIFFTFFLFSFII